MTMPNERTRALLWGGSFLVKVARDKSLPLELRREAVVIARHFPTIEDIGSMATPQYTALFGSPLAHPSEVDWRDEGDPGPLTYSTRLAWPEAEATPRPRKRKTPTAAAKPSADKDPG